mgnify:CR=1 FL=1
MVDMDIDKLGKVAATGPLPQPVPESSRLALMGARKNDNLPDLTYLNYPDKSNSSDLEKNPKIAVEIEQVIRDQSSSISKELEGNPSPKEKVSDKDEN